MRIKLALHNEDGNHVYALAEDEIPLNDPARVTAAALDLKYLNDEELDHPEEVFTSFFECVHLHEAKELLAKLKPVAMDDDTQYFFEKLEKLIEAAWMMR